MPLEQGLSRCILALRVEIERQVVTGNGGFRVAVSEQRAVSSSAFSNIGFAAGAGRARRGSAPGCCSSPRSGV